jgi:hypothetical protein
VRLGNYRNDFAHHLRRLIEYQWVDRPYSAAESQSNNRMINIDDELNYVVEPAIRPYSGPLYFARSRTDAADVSNSGTFALIDTGARKLSVTRHHVWEGLLNEQRNDPEVKMFLCVDSKPPIVFDPPEPIDADPELDLATFDIEKHLGTCDARRFYPLSSKPPPAVKIGDRLALMAFPASLRSTSDGMVGFGRMPLGVNVTDLTPLYIKADVSKSRIVFYSERNVGRSPYRGISGSARFLIRGHKPPYLVGFTSQIIYETLSFTHARFLQPDGCIRR